MTDGQRVREDGSRRGQAWTYRQTYDVLQNIHTILHHHLSVINNDEL